MSPAEVMQLAVIAAQLSGRTLNEYVPPQVLELSTADMNLLACPLLPPAHEDPCLNVIGRYVDAGPYVYVDIQWLRGNPQSVVTERNIVVHELVHWLQYIHFEGGGDCLHLYAREVEAYRIQTRYLVEYEHKHAELTAPPPWEHCP